MEIKDKEYSGDFMHFDCPKCYRHNNVVIKDEELDIYYCSYCGAVAVVSGGYKLFTATSHFSVSEGTEVQYWNGASWMSLAVDGSTFDLGQVDIKPGETNTFALRARNNASNGVIGIKLQIETIDGITHDVLCRQDSNGLQYTKGTDVYLFKAPADNVWRAVDITTSISGDFPVGNVEFGNTLTRHNAETTYAITCGV